LKINDLVKISDTAGMQSYEIHPHIVCYGIVRNVALARFKKIAHVDILWLTGIFKGEVRSHLPIELSIVCENILQNK